ncbi:hypothetical protein MPTK1_3g05800 [Marchantia polymorpha subsp. ruderalis]|uniref:CCHC-type domain-containing protein n=2 Tax=Marchantia polymorpha TaxID=3197 RepID=A0AAF6AXT8_MARPO|nr:hypothetical protein MARPO_0006s0051 [Marchantia polymorpha]BBN04572.1 hypothetical protein Mp_3g05800 [Marchantia polymorpha subsp. ruderalis]PTQ48010.1 hypothetical protein MARPO_0006s0051 [Marchantia polymorpha]PTQ48011.1 hypothetical protein MARPO_0006s0051 [Marchantia polymorpha]BBN04573.1 hypothetical protein Mp_3g05800 [Marchantia polymorpha subsp. ruderalis]|eukprot:PTQ48009.1 hypothetical protein MARPO_0006s0051 [Marchantia polymorpha]
MPATAGRVRMPANNRVHSSAALQTHGIWQSAIGYDPYAPDQKSQPDDRGGAPAASTGGGGITEEQQNAYDSFQGLLALARLTASSADEVRGACKKCGRVGHLTFQCRNFLTAKEEAAAAAAAVLDKERGAKGKEGISESDFGSDDSDDDSSDSDEDPEMERAIAEKFGWKGKGGSTRAREKGSTKTGKSKRSSKSVSKHRRSSKKKASSEESSDCSSDSDTRSRRKRHEKEKKRRRDRSPERGRRRHRDEKRRRKSRYSNEDDSSDSSLELPRKNSHRKGREERRKKRDSSPRTVSESNGRHTRKSQGRRAAVDGDSDGSPKRKTREEYRGRKPAMDAERDYDSSDSHEMVSRKHRHEERRSKGGD